ncbi:hypothetical protein Avbf_13888 [Armadillidium vulgare]|nr:hypothetical protein Avbf_13888 [Armadillidium vulgare]
MRLTLARIIKLTEYCKAFEASEMLKETTIDHHLAIFGTDFNSEPCDIPFKIFIYNSGFRDSFTTCEKEPPIGTEITSGNPRNSYTVSDSEKRIDYILYKHTEDYKVEVLLHDHPLPAKVPFKDFSYSDHEALRTVISIERKSSINSDEPVVNDNTRNCNMLAGEEKTFLEAYKICDDGLQNALRYQLLWFSITLGLIVFIPMLMWYFVYNDESRCENRSTEIERFTEEEIIEESSDCLLCWLIIILSTFCVVLLFFSLYMSFISARRECNSLRKAKNFIFQKFIVSQVKSILLFLRYINTLYFKSINLNFYMISIKSSHFIYRYITFSSIYQYSRLTIIFIL